MLLHWGPGKGLRGEAVHAAAEGRAGEEAVHGKDRLPPHGRHGQG